MINLGIGIPFRRMGAGIDAQAQAHYDRVIADGGLIPSGLVGVNNFFTTVKAIYGTSDITTAISVGLDAQVLGYKLGAGAGTTAGQAAQKLYSCSGSSGDVEQTVASSQPLLLVHSGANYWFGSGVAGNFLSTPNAAANQITGDIEVYAKVSFNRFGAGTLSSSGVVGKWIGSNNNSSFILYVNLVSKKIGYVFRVASTNLSNESVSAFTYAENQIFEIKMTRVASSGVVTISTKLPSETNYTQLYQVTDTSGALNGGSCDVTVGNDFNGATFMGIGANYKSTLSNSIGGSPVVDFNPNQYNAATSQTQWTSTTGEVWTINTGTATGGYKGLIVDKTYIQNDGVDDFLIATTSGSGIKSQYFTHKVLSGSGGVPFGLWTGSAFSQSFYYPSGSQYGFYQSGPQDGPFGVNVFGTKKLRVSGAVGGTGTNWIPFQDGVDVSNGGANIGSSTSYTSIRIGVRGNDTGYDNGIVGNYIISGQADTAPQRTAMQALLKTISNL
jgi:hypothetical protein